MCSFFTGACAAVAGWWCGYDAGFVGREGDELVVLLREITDLAFFLLLVLVLLVVRQSYSGVALFRGSTTYIGKYRATTAQYDT